MSTAIFVDAGFFLKRFQAVYPMKDFADAALVARTLHEMARIGLDIASVSYKKLVDQIVLVAGDADFVPAAKLARREGIDFIIDPMWNPIAEDLHEHIDGLRSTCPRPVTQDA